MAAAASDSPSSSSPTGGSLHGALLSALRRARTPAGLRTFQLTTLRSQPYRSYTLFPHASDQSRRVFKEDILVLLAEKGSAGLTVPVYGLEAALYSVPSTATCLLYVSKVDTTGLLSTASPARLLTVAFLSHHLGHQPHGARSVRVHIFARAAREGQYLFPDSVSNVKGGQGDGAKTGPGKRLLDDQQLIRWWKAVLAHAVRDATAPPAVPETQLRCFYLLPGFDYAESLPLVPPPSTMAFPHWVYGHPYGALSSPVIGDGHVGESVPLSDLIPAFSDDPQSRFLSSLASSTINSSGEVGDWDDYTAEALEATASAAVVARRKDELEQVRRREKAKIDRVSADEFWERMGARQECSDGRVSAFFVVAREGETGSTIREGPPLPEPGATINGSASPSPSPKKHSLDAVLAEAGATPRNVWTKLWSQVAPMSCL